MDAVDAGLVELGGKLPRLVATLSGAWPERLLERMKRLAGGEPLDATAVAILDTEVGRFIAQVVKDLLATQRIDARRVQAIGCHGQTVAHVPEGEVPTTWQLGDANIIAERTGITTINDFRRRDMAAGGQGAPLAPAFHAAVLRDRLEERVVLNLGGIANVTVLPTDDAADVTGFDTGPANCLLDLWARRHLGQPFDRDGAWAESEHPDTRFLAHLKSDPYFDLLPPKSTGTQYFSAAWLDARLGTTNDLSPAKVQATLLALSSATVADAISRHAPKTQRVLVCGGGVHNRALMRQLTQTLGIPVESTARHGVDPDWVEAMAFAWLAERTLSSRHGNLPTVTGSSGPRILGAIHPA